MGAMLSFIRHGMQNATLTLQLGFSAGGAVTR
jgi:hypothetical protein